MSPSDFPFQTVDPKYIQFLMKLDKRFKKDPWVEVRLAQRYFSRS